MAARNRNYELLKNQNYLLNLLSFSSIIEKLLELASLHGTASG
jgi:hypothetical protein